MDFRGCGGFSVITPYFAVNALAKDLRSQLARTVTDPDTRATLLYLIGGVAGRLKEGGEEASAEAQNDHPSGPRDRDRPRLTFRRRPVDLVGRLVCRPRHPQPASSNGCDPSPSSSSSQIGSTCLTTLAFAHPPS